MRRLILWGTVFLAFRLLCLYFLVDAAWTPEETYRGTLGLEFLRALYGHALSLPFSCYQADAYLGGSLATGALSAVTFALFAPSLFALKLTAILFALAALLVAYRWLEKACGRPAADSFAALYTFAPPAFVYLGATAMGYHTESVLFFAILLALTTSVSGPRRLFFLGLTGGFAFWFSNLNGLAFAAALVSGPNDWRKLRGQISLLLGALLGLAPWFLRNLTSNADAFRHLAWSFSGEGHVGRAAKALQLFTHALPLSSGLPAPLAWVFFALTILLLAFGWRRAPRPLRRFTLAYAALFGVLYVASNFAIYTTRYDPLQFRYLQPLWFLVFLCISAATHRRRPALLALLPISLAGILLTTDRVAPPSRAWSYRGYSYADFSSKQMNGCLKGPENLPGLLRWIHSGEEPTRTYLEIPFTGAYDFTGWESAPLPPEARNDPYFARGLGAFAAAHLAPEAILARAEGFTPESGQSYWLGVSGAARFFPVPTLLRKNLSTSRMSLFTALDATAHLCLAGVRPPALTSQWEARGQGAGVADCGFSPAGIRELAEAYTANQGDEYKANFAWGLGWRLRLRHLPDPLRSLDRIAALPEWARAKALEGALAQERELGLTGKESVGGY